MTSYPLHMFVILIILSLLPIAIAIGTSFLKFSITFSLLRNAMGLQQIPSNMVIYALSLIMTMVVMAPQMKSLTDYISSHKNEKITLDGLSQTAGPLLDSYHHFLKRNTDQKEVNFIAHNIDYFMRKDGTPVKTDKSSLMVMVPAFTLTQLSEAFKIGLYINLPFIAVDLIVSNLLLALGMMMVSPITISLPFKLLIFIFAGGWDLLAEQLFRSMH